MSKKGFTLVEVIGVVAILSFIILMIVPNISDSLKNSRNKSFEVQVEEIVSAAKSWSAYNSSNLPDTSNDEITIELLQLKLAGLLPYDFTNPRTGELFPDDMQIKITKKGLSYDYTVLTDTGSDNVELNPTAPTIILYGSAYMYIEVNTPYSIPGAACDEENVSVVEKYEKKQGNSYVQVSEIDFNELGEYIITYSATGIGGMNSIKRYVEIVDKTPPQIDVSGYSNNVCVDLELTNNFTFPSVTATDNYTPSISLKQEIIGNISRVPGIKRVTYRVTDSSNNSSDFVLCVNMKDTKAPQITSVTSSYNSALQADIITVIASDEGVGLHDFAYSFDGGINWQSENYIATNNSEITVVVRDKIGLISASKTI